MGADDGCQWHCGAATHGVAADGSTATAATMTPRRCSLCPSTYAGSSPFCEPCLARQREAVAEIAARSARIASGDLSLFSEGATAGEREDILRARRDGNVGGIVL
jgi:hypothetical protein